MTPEEEAGELSRIQTQSGWNPRIRSWGDLNFWTTDEQRDLFVGWLRKFGPASKAGYAISPHAAELRNEPSVSVSSWVPAHWIAGKSLTWTYIQKALEDGEANIPLSSVVLIAGRAHGVGRNWDHKDQTWLARHVFNRLTLSRANLELAGYKVAKADQVNRQHVVDAAIAFGIRTDISSDNMGGALAFQIADAATSQGLTIPQVVEIYGDDNVQGAGSILSELWNDAKDWFNDAVTKNIGRALAWVGEQILNARDSVPYLGTFFLDPLGISLLAETLRQVGEYFRTGDAATSFNERALGFELGTHWTALGQALIVAGGIISSSGIGLPLGAILTAVGILLYAAGNTITGEMRAREARSRARKADKELEEMQKQLAKECRAKLEAEGLSPEEIPKDADKCVQAYEDLQDTKEEILSASEPASDADSRKKVLFLTLAAAAYLLTR